MPYDPTDKYPLVLRQIGGAGILGHASKLMTHYYTSTSLEEMLDAVRKVKDSNKEEATDKDFRSPPTSIEALRTLPLTLIFPSPPPPESWHGTHSR